MTDIANRGKRIDSLFGFFPPEHRLPAYSDLTVDEGTMAIGSLYSTLFSRYKRLAPLPRLLLQCCAVLGEPASPAALLHKLLPQAALPRPEEERVDQEIIHRNLQDLRQDGLLAADQQCHPAVIELICRAMDKALLVGLARIVQEEWPAVIEDGDAAPMPDQLRLIRDLRLNLCLGNWEGYAHTLLLYLENFGNDPGTHPLVLITTSPFDPPWFGALPAHVQIYALQEICKHCIARLAPFGPVLAYLKNDATIAALPAEAHPALLYLRTTALLLTGQVKAAKATLAAAGDLVRSLGLHGWLALVTGHYQEARRRFADDLPLLRQSNQNESAFFTGMEGFFALLAMFQTGDPAHLNSMAAILDALPTIQPHNPFLAAYAELRNALQMQGRMTSSHYPEPQTEAAQAHDGLVLLCRAWTCYWTNAILDDKDLAGLIDGLSRAKASGHRWLALEYAEILARMTGRQTSQRYANRVRRETGLVPLIDILGQEEPWQRALKALNAPQFLVSPGRREGSGNRIAWLINLETPPFTLIAKEQKRTVTGAWSRGRLLSPRKLAHHEALPALSPQDLAVCASLRRHEGPWGIAYAFDMEKALPALVGHPNVYLHDHPEVNIQLQKGEPEVRVEERGDAMHISFFPAIGDTPYVIHRESLHRFSFIEISRIHRRYARVIGPLGLIVPAAERERAMRILGGLKPPVTIHATMDHGFAAIEKVAADPRIHVHLAPAGTGFRAALYVKPFREGGPYLTPGMGAAKVVTEIGGRRLQTLRAIELEEKRAREVEDACPSLALPSVAFREWLIQETDACLQLLSELHGLGKKIIVEWPEGRKLSVSRPISFAQLHLQIRQQRNWFEMTGSLELEPSLTLDMRRLLDLAEKSPSRFIPLGNGQFLTLSRELRTRLDDLNAIADKKKDGCRLHPLAALHMNALRADGARVSGDKAWNAWLQKARQARAYCPVLPSTLQAELRDYQSEGFTWLARLAYWGVGACLADDMGLGKTLQALSIILLRAAAGPTLVVAPTSVCLNWQEEAKRFAPTLNIVLFGGRNRGKLLAALGPFDVLVASYGLLQHESQALAAAPWVTIVLDEAQAIKNRATKRSRAAMALRGDFRIITTGTPIENHLGELWNLFQFLNPGLLGPLDRFQKRFAVPIERDGRRDIRLKLKKLVQPFILRRLKSEVLDELPPRTEVTLKVQMKRQERAFYEAIRQRAVETLHNDGGRPAEKHVRILTEITRLRRCCCNPRLILPGTTIPSAKLEEFGRIVEELLEGGHKALVFSQFVGHLALIREYLNKRAVSYQYLDGATPANQRARRVAAFQAGTGDLFLISLKAGGVGLNLTAADYVIHLDPWWNPAVEDQASDRAHRIGQQRPVTVYRLVAENTIEEKIVALHRAKKDLAASLLEGGNLTGKMNSQELLELIVQP